MRSIYESCQPRKSILEGTFNPEVFTAALGPVIDYYRSGHAAIDSVYTDAEAFFTEATYPTEGLRQTVSNVFRRISGDQTAPSIYRLETSFGGGKTHALIACVHIASRGTELASVTSEILDAQYLPEPGSVSIVGIAGDEIPVNKTRGDRLIPYTLWGEMAYQIGGEDLYREVKTEAESFAAPGRHFLDTVLGSRKVLIMLDELAQYAARLEAAVQGKGSDQLAAFIMALNGYAKMHPGIAVVVTLAGSADAFSRQTATLTELLNRIGSGDLEQEDAVALAERASQGVTSVVMRDATAVTPVQAAELSSVLAKRLFESIDPAAAEETTKEYLALYQDAPDSFPEEAVSASYQDRMLSSYPFHPTLIDFLNNKLALAENFQGTRGVLRVLAMTVRSLWAKKMPIQLIQVSDIDLRNSAIVDEILGRTGSADLRQVLNADIGSSESAGMSGGLSNAERADQRNPHPDGIPLYEKTWKVVFLNSLVGRGEGLASKVFGVGKQDAVFQTAAPLLAPQQIEVALKEINESAFYLRCEGERYYAHTEPTLNSVLAMIRPTISGTQIWQKLRAVADNLVQDNDPRVRIERSVCYPEDIADGKDKLTVAVIALDAQKVDPMQLLTEKGKGKPRERQNMILLLIPKTVIITDENPEQMQMDGLQEAGPARDARERLEGLARQVLAMATLKERPQAYGILPSKLNSSEFKERESARNLSLQQAVADMYTAFCYPGSTGSIQKREIRPAVGDRGSPIISQILEALKENGDIILTDSGRIANSDMRGLAGSFFFKNIDRVEIPAILHSFRCNRTWPMLFSTTVLEQMLRAGVNNGIWVAYRMSNDLTDDKPAELYSQRKPLPMDVDLMNGGYSIMTVAGANSRGWLDSDRVSNEKVKSLLKDSLQSSGAVTVKDLVEAVQAQADKATEDQIKDNIRELLQSSGYSLYQGTVNQLTKPSDLIDGLGAYSHDIQPDEVLITRQELVNRGWVNARSKEIRLSGHDGAKKLFPLLRRMGSMYTRGATSVIEELDIAGLELPGGGILRFAVEKAGPADIKQMDELLQTLASVTRLTDSTEADLYIANPGPNCAFAKELKK